MNVRNHENVTSYSPPKNKKTKQVQRLNKFHWKNIITQKKNQAQRGFTDFIAGADVVFIAVLQMLE
jgi:hypothetical protein